MMKCFGNLKKSHIFHCKVVLLDETELIHEVNQNSKGQDLQNVVYRHLNLLETAYFGLRFVDKNGQTKWLEPGKSIVRQVKNVNHMTFYFAVKFYVSDPCKLLEEITRYQFFLQLKQDIAHSRLPVPYDLLIQLFAYAVQSELGDYDPRRNAPNYISEFNFAPHQESDLELKVATLHKALIGQTPATAEMNFLEKAKWLDLYGADLHPVMGEDNVEYFLGLTPSGVVVLRNKTKVGNYFWPRIGKISRKERYFMLKVIEKRNESNTYGFELPSKQACKHLYKCCREHQAFFRLTQGGDDDGAFAGFTRRFPFNGQNNLIKKSNSLTKSNSLRDRPPSAVVRVPSRRYQRKANQGSVIDGIDLKDNDPNAVVNNSGLIHTDKCTSQPPLYRSTSVPGRLPVDDSSSNINSAPWDNPHQKGLFSSCADVSPDSIRNNTLNNHHRSSQHSVNHTYYDDSKNIPYSKTNKACESLLKDNEDVGSEYSRCSRGSRRSHHSTRSNNSHSSRHHRHHHHRHHHHHHSHHRCRSKSRGHGDDSDGGESDSSRRRHRRRRQCCSDANFTTLVDSGEQWKEIQEQQKRLENNMIRSNVQSKTAQTAQTRQFSQRYNSSYVNPAMEYENEENMNDYTHQQRHQSKSGDSNRRPIIPKEVQKHLEYDLIEPKEEDKRNISYTKVDIINRNDDVDRIFKLRHAPNSGHINVDNNKNASENFHVNEFEFTRNPLDLATHSKNLLENQIQQLGSSNPGRMNNYRTTATTNGNYMYDNNKREVNRGREYNQENYSSQLIDNNLMLKSSRNGHSYQAYPGNISSRGDNKINAIRYSQCQSESTTKTRPNSISQPITKRMSTAQYNCNNQMVFGYPVNGSLHYNDECGKCKLYKSTE